MCGTTPPVKQFKKNSNDNISKATVLIQDYLQQVEEEPYDRLTARERNTQAHR